MLPCLPDHWAATRVESSKLSTTGEGLASLARGVVDEFVRSSSTTQVAVVSDDPLLAVATTVALAVAGYDAVVSSTQKLGRFRAFAQATGATLHETIEVTVEGVGDQRCTVSLIPFVLPATKVSTGRVVFTTSGSTGVPKLVPFRIDQVQFIVSRVTDAIAYRRNDRVLSVVPVAFDYGFYQVLFALYAGCAIRVAGNVTLPRATVDELRRGEYSVLPVTPAFARALVASMGPGEAPCRSMRLITSTGSPMLAPLQARLRAVFPQATILPMYGLTECKRVSIATPDLATHEPSSVGYPLPGTEVEIVGPDHEVLGPNSIGEAVVRGPHVAHGYYGAVEQGRSLRQEAPGRWVLHTGDAMWRSEDGALHHHGRLDRDIVKLRDERVSIIQIEEVVRQCPGVVEARAAAGYDADNLVETILVDVEATDDVDLEDARRTVRSEVGASVAAALEFRRVSKIELTEHGKVRPIMEATHASDPVWVAIGAIWRDRVGDDAPIPDLDADLLESEAFDSLVLLDMVSDLERRLGIRVPNASLVPEAIGTLRRLLATVSRLVEEQK